MKIPRFFFIFTVLFLLNSALAQSTYVPLNHPVYDYINRIETKGYINKFLSGTKPFTRKECAKVISEVAKHPDNLTDFDKESILFYLVEFREEFEPEEYEDISNLFINTSGTKKPEFIPESFYKNDRNLLHFKEDKINFFIDPIAYIDFKSINADSANGKNKIKRLTGGFKVWGSFGKNLGFYADYRNTKEWGLKYPVKVNYSLDRLGFVNGYGTHIYHDETIAYLVAGFSLFELELGKNINKWGPGYRGNLILSDYAASYDLIKFKTSFWRVKFCSIMGFLRSYPQITYENTVKQDNIETTRDMNSKKYIAAHRLEFNLTDRLDIGFNEVVIYGDRGLEFAYLNPIMFYRSAEHYLGDMDNAAMSFDFNWVPVNGFRVYGEFFLDDVTIKKIGSDWYGNKFAYLAGVFITDPLKLRDSEILFEYARIKPFVYTHHYSINVYKHFTSPLGYFTGPNSETYFLLFSKYFSRKSKISFEFDLQKHGSNYADINIGGDINSAHMPGDTDNVQFLDGIVEKKVRLGLKYRYDIFRHFYFSAEFDYEKAENVLVENNRTSVESVDFMIGFGINY
ncbi:capsule assembly Wzi family protein [candidate division KSB1 bacterium]